MTTNLTLDKAGRLVLPKPLRDRMQLGPGTVMQLDSEGESITLRPVRPKAALAKEHGIWVYQGKSSEVSIPDLIESVRTKRVGETLP